MTLITDAIGKMLGQRNILEVVVLGVNVALIIAFAILVDGFATLGNLSVILSNSTPLAILSCGMAVVIISRGLDLSIIAVMVAGATTYASGIEAGLPGGLALLITAAAMITVGMVNAWLIAFAELPAMLATLASAMVIMGLFRFAILQGEFMLLLPKSNSAVQILTTDILPGISVPIVVTAVVLVATWVLLSRTIVGEIIYAMGDNFAAARLSGLPVRPVTVVIYVWAALMAMLAGLLISSASGAVDFRMVTNGSLLFDVILVVVLGGIPLRGGRGGLRNIILGVALIAVLRNGMTLMNVTTQTQDVIKGIVLLVAIATENFLNPRDIETDTVGDL
ncbi:ABC transporter permease [Sulfitobacter sp. CW3]|uniref:ABC transporter permease n=1 Tax=Sulfitobacter sp. CW3 TaxID=2861965 RepID=UPI001C5F9401|nr:ABC transporter permease [Sulfitobacter sp. CW3]MBW4963382.1 ABC transporter permease [Sulfitobacter sp. CW3]